MTDKSLKAPSILHCNIPGMIKRRVAGTDEHIKFGVEGEMIGGMW